MFAKFKKYRGLKVKRRKEESSDEEEESTQNSTKDDVQNVANVASEIKSDQAKLTKLDGYLIWAPARMKLSPSLFCAKDFRVKFRIKVPVHTFDICTYIIKNKKNIF